MSSDLVKRLREGSVIFRTGLFSGWVDEAATDELMSAAADRITELEAALRDLLLARDEACPCCDIGEEAWDDARRALEAPR